MNNQKSTMTNAEILSIIQKEFIPHQNFNYAFLGGLGVSLLCAVIWATISVVTEYQIGLLAIVIGLIIGFSVRYFGAGLTSKFGILGAGLALFSCILGNLFTNIGFIANYQGTGYIETFKFLDFSMIKDLMVESFSPMDLFFYGIAAYEGFKFSIRNPTNDDLEDYYKERFTGVPFLNTFRAPLAIGSFLILAVVWFLLSGKVSGIQDFRYEDGTISATGNYNEGLEDGQWEYFHQNGQTQAKGNYKQGLEEGTWEFFDSTGQVIKSTEYKGGMMHGKFLTYTEGSILDSGQYVNNREEGKWISKYPNGQIALEGNMKHGKNEGIWSYYHKNGQLSRRGSINKNLKEGHWQTWDENGILTDEEIYKEGEVSKILFVHRNGKDIVVNGNGEYEYFDEEANVRFSGILSNGKNIGLWKSYYPDGSVCSEIMYENDDQTIQSIFDRNGQQLVKDGNGKLVLTYESGNLEEEGQIKQGKQHGSWTEYYDSPKAIFVSSVYKEGVLDGKVTTYNADHSIWSEGPYKDDLQEGTWKWYYPNGLVESEVEYKKGEKDGVQIFYSETGMEIKHEIYEHGQLLEEKILN